MALQLRNYQRNPITVNKGFPLLNSLFVENYSLFGNYQQETSYKRFMHWIRKSPQIMGLLNIIACDILSDDIHFVPFEKNASARNRKLAANKFFSQQNGRDIIESMIYDLLYSGQGYIWKGKLDDKKVKSIVSKYETKEISTAIDTLKKDSPDLFLKKISVIPSSTVSPQNNEYEITKYIQRVGTNTKVFDVEEVIRFQLMPIDGKVQGFAPLEALLTEVYLLWLISQNNVSYFENGGSPDKVFILPKEMANSKNHAYLVEALKKYKQVENRHGNLVFTGDIKIEDLQKTEMQMEHRELSLYLTSVIAMFYGIPVGRIPFLIGKAANNGDAGGLADSGYWRKISVLQSKIEERMNNDLWIPYFGVQMRFGRGYKQDEVRETTIEKTKTDIAEQRIRLGLWTSSAAAEYLDIDEDVLMEAQAELKKREQDFQNNFNQKYMTDNEVMKEPDSLQKASVKRKAAEGQMPTP